MLARKWHDACPSEIARKVQELLAPYGVSETTCALVGHDLASGKSDSSEESTGIAAFTINVEEGLTEIPTKRLVMSALTIGLSYFIGGLIPIIPYFCTPDALKGLYWSIVSFPAMTSASIGLADA
jgi:VIT1/CCC1 family predicted Fe2+/Mn2+ transporter